MEYLIDGDEADDDRDKKTYKMVLRKVPLVFAVITMAYIIVKILLIPIHMNNYHVLISGLFALVGTAIGILLMEKLDRPMLSVFGFILIAVVLFIFMDESTPIETVLCVITGILIFLIKVIMKRLKYL